MSYSGTPWAPLCFCLALGLTSDSAFSDEEDAYVKRRLDMVRAITADVHATSDYIGQSSLNPDVMTAMGTVPRHEFVPKSSRRVAYRNRPLSIGHGQTISQPYIVALMTDFKG